MTRRTDIVVGVGKNGRGLAPKRRETASVKFSIVMWVVTGRTLHAAQPIQGGIHGIAGVRQLIRSGSVMTRQIGQYITVVHEGDWVRG